MLRPLFTRRACKGLRYPISGYILSPKSISFVDFQERLHEEFVRNPLMLAVAGIACVLC